MIAVQLTRPGLLEVVEREEPTLGANEALVAVRRIGVCGTDWHAFAGRQPFFNYPRVLGHELGVEILALGSSHHSDLSGGDACAVEPYLNEPTSQASRMGKTNCCEELKVLGVHVDGGMCPRLVLPLTKLHRSAALSFDQLALVETLCIGAHAVDRARLDATDRVLVVGAGPIGLGVAAFARMGCPTVAMADVDADRLAFVGKTQPGLSLINARAGDLGLQASDALGGPPTVVFDATGNKGSMEQAFSVVANGGRIIFVGLFQGEVSFSDPEFHRKELSILASRNATSVTFRRVIQALEKGDVDVTPWITDRLVLEEVPHRFETMATRTDRIKAIISVP